VKLMSSWGNWQYQAGVGNDARSSRQFNPIKQAKDYDGEGKYVRLWIPELKDIPDEYLQTPWREFLLNMDVVTPLTI
jgi:deoxyribodipyrimidine photo-lyase